MNEAAARAAATAETAARPTRQRARDLAFVLNRTAAALEHSALLADDHAERHARAGKTDAATAERQAARQAHEASERARARAVRCLELAGSP